MSRKRDKLLFFFGILLSFAGIGIILSNPLYLQKRIAEINEEISSTMTVSMTASTVTLPTVITATTTISTETETSTTTTKLTTSLLGEIETTSSRTVSTITNNSTTKENRSTTTTASTGTLTTSSTTKTPITTETATTQQTETMTITATTSEARTTTEPTTIESLTLTTSTFASTTEGDMFCKDQYNKSCYYFAVFPSKLRDNYLISGDGKHKRSTNVIYPENDRRYLEEAVFAMFKDELFIFGGKTNPNKVAVFIRSKCEFQELPFKIPLDSGPGGAALSIDNDSKLLACFADNIPSRQCIIIIDRDNFEEVESTTYSHYWGRLALWNKQPTTVGGDVDFKKVETFKDGKWTELTEQPEKYFGHSLIGLRDGSLLKLGGINVHNENRPYYNAPTPEIFQLTAAGCWTQLGDLQKPVSFGSSFYIGQIASIYIFPGKGDPDGNNPIERLDLTTITGEIQTEIIGYHDSDHYVPVLLHAEHDFCV